MRVLVLGGSGQVGKCLQKIQPNWTYWSSQDCDLLDYYKSVAKIRAFEPDVIVNLAAIVNGIQFNKDNQNLMFELNTRLGLNAVSAINEVRKQKDARLIQILSTCMYPAIKNESSFPLKEIYAGFGDLSLLEPTNKGYALSKRVIQQAVDFNREMGSRDCYLIPCNLYSEYDNFDLYSGHFVPALIRKIMYAKKNGLKTITNWGSGQPMRQFMYAGDLAQAISLWVYYDISDSANVATDENYTIKQITEIALDSCDAQDIDVFWDDSKPDGIFRKDVDCSLLKSQIKWEPTLLRDGIKKVYQILETQTQTC
jgi:GDP-L-fucose synthase